MTRIPPIIQVGDVLLSSDIFTEWTSKPAKASAA